MSEQPRQDRRVDPRATTLPGAQPSREQDEGSGSPSPAPFNPASNGLVLYRGPSLLDRAPIVAVLTGLWRPSANRKTGAMLQTWILRDGQSPLDAVRTGDDVSVCGHCPLRSSPRRGRRCYVNLGRAPLAVYRALVSGVYPDATDLSEIAEAGHGRSVRIGSYGDPAAVPTDVWLALVSRAWRWTGYTHQWDRPGFDPRLLDLCMASVDREEDLPRLASRHPAARYFRIRPPGTAAAADELQCPAADEAGNACAARPAAPAMAAREADPP